MFATILISAAALVVAALALYKNWKSQTRLLQIEQSREQAKIMQSLQAVLRANLCKTGQNSWRLFVLNKGLGTARNVTITLDGKPLLEHDAVPRGQQEAKTIGPESQISYCMAISMGCHPPFEFGVTWDDDSGQQGSYGTTLTF